MIKKHFKGSIIFTIVAILIGFCIGAGSWRNISAWLQAVFIILILGVLETSLSFDNAVVNASILKKMSPLRQQRFLTRGIAIAVFGMRVIFPVIIVAIVGHINPLAAFQLALINPAHYAEILVSSRIMISGFGGTFLFMVALKFFLDKEKKNHWIGAIEKFLQKIGELKSVEIFTTLLLVIGISYIIPVQDSQAFIIASLRGIIIYTIMEALSSLLQDGQRATKAIVKTGLSLFIYLELLDASFSFDWVIGAFALSKNIFIIALGLGIGAMFVRSLTILMVEKWTLTKYRFLEHGAFRAIFALAAIMFISTVYEVPEVITGLIWGACIGLALWSSIKANKKK